MSKLKNYLKKSEQTGWYSYRRRIPAKLKESFLNPDGKPRGNEWKQALKTKSISIALKRAVEINDRFEQTKARAKAKSLTPSQIRKLLVRCQLMQNPELKRVVLALSFSTLRVSELAQLTVDDVLMPTGAIKEEIYLRASLCKRRKPRSIWLSKLAKQMIQEWVDYRKSHNWATTFNNTYYFIFSRWRRNKIRIRSIIF